MSYRRVILKRLRHFYDNVGAAEASYLTLDPIDIVGKRLSGKEGEKYAAAVNQLLREGLIVAVVIGKGRAAYSLNSNRLDDVRKQLHWWRNAEIVWIVPVLVALAALLWAIFSFFLRR